MYIVDKIVYADTPLEMIKVREAKVLDNMIMIITFASGEKRLFDASFLLNYPAFKDLSDSRVFRNPEIDHGVVTWNNGRIDIAPETMYQKSYEYY